MRPEIHQLKALHIKQDAFIASHFVKDILAAEITHLKHLSQHGSFHEHVKKNGYPLPTAVVSHSSYVRRKSVEQKLSSALKNNRHVILIGCEGCGKTTLVHYVLGTIRISNVGLRLYIDASDVEGSGEDDVERIVFQKLANAIIQISDTELGNEFQHWVDKCKTDVFLQSIIDVSSPKGLAESFIAFLRTHDSTHKSYVILDNLDSLSIHANQILFSSINRLDETVAAVCKRLHIKDNKNVRFIICCRTPTYQHISGTALGLFLNFAHDEIQVEDDFLKNTNILDLMREFLLKPASRAHTLLSSAHGPIPMGSFTLSMTMDSYFSDVIKWLQNSESTFNRTIKMFCGRSIRRAKFYSLKVLGNPFLAKLALFEKHGAVKITRTDKAYLKRRILEAIFDFTPEGYNGFPMNPYRVVHDEQEHKSNPLIGVNGVNYLHDNRDELSDKQVFFASSIIVEPLYEYFIKIGYSKSAIKDFFVASRNSGLLRPVPSSDIILEDTFIEYRNIYRSYVIDDHALQNIFGLVNASDPEISIAMYNAATRSAYGLGGPRVVDNWLTEAFTSLIFLFDFLKREKLLEEMLDGTGIMVVTPSSRFQARILSKLFGIVSAFDEGQPASTDGMNTRLQKKLIQTCYDLFSDIKNQLRSRSDIL